jgi:hypothetical protein
MRLGATGKGVDSSAMDDLDTPVRAGQWHHAERVSVGLLPDSRLCWLAVAHERRPQWGLDLVNKVPWQRWGESRDQTPSGPPESHAHAACVAGGRHTDRQCRDVTSVAILQRYTCR